MLPLDYYFDLKVCLYQKERKVVTSLSNSMIDSVPNSDVHTQLISLVMESMNFASNVPLRKPLAISVILTFNIIIIIEHSPEVLNHPWTSSPRSGEKRAI